MMTKRNDVETAASKVFSSMADHLAIMGGNWPATVTLDGKLFKQAFKEYDGDGQLEAVVYKAADGSRLFVNND